MHKLGIVRKLLISFLAGLLLSFSLTACVDQHPETSSPDATSGDDVRVVVTSVAIMEIMDRLDVELTGVPTSDNASYPVRYATTEQVGMPMAPDIELLHSLAPDLILSPKSLEADLQPKYDAAYLNSVFMDLRSLDGMHNSIREVAEMLDRQVQAQVIIDEYEEFLAEYRTKLNGKEQPRVLILMGLPGSYTVATETSYVGSLIKQAGGINVYEEETEEFVNVNTEDMLARDPDIILRTAHALPDSVMKMFAEEFSENDIWQHFRAVQTGKVYDLSYEDFGMSANFHYKEALNAAYELLYESK